MYLKYYQLAVKPFDLSLKPGFLWMGEKHSEALATLKYGVQEDLGFLLLTGDVGAGKTVMIRRLLNSLDKKTTIVAHITDPGLAPLEFFKMVAEQFNIPGEVKSKVEFLIKFEKFLQQAHADQKKVLLLVDEAQRLNDELLDQIRVLSNIERSDRKLINIFFIGQPEFKNMLLTDANRPLLQRIAVNYHIDPLTEPEVAQYIAHRLRKAGRNRNLFNPDAVHEIFKYTKGYPRAINIICDHALLTGFSAGLETIDSNVIKECKQELKIQADLREEEAKTKKEPRPKPTVPVQHLSPVKKSRSLSIGGYSLVIGICILLSVFLVYLLMRPDPNETSQPEQRKQSAEFSNPLTKSLENDQWRLDEKIEMEKSFAASQTPSASLSQPLSDTKTGTQTKWETDKEVVQNKAEPNKELLPLPSSPKIEIHKEATTPRTVVAKNSNSSEKKTIVADSKTAVSSAQPSPSSGKAVEKKETDVVIPDKSLQAMAVMSAVMTTKPVAKPKKSPPRQPKKQRTVPKPESKSTVVKEKPVPQNTNDVSTYKKQTKKSVTQPSKAKTSTALAAVIASTPSKTPAAAPAAKQSSQISTSKAAKGRMSPKPDSTFATQADKTVKKPVVGTPTASSKSSVASSSEKKSDIGLENRIRWFLKSYCVTYTKKDIDAFSKFFVPGALENGKPIETLFPKYKRNFEHIETIQYRIDLKHFSADQNKESVLVEGNFSLQWLPGDRKWRENSGTIAMTLVDNGQSFLVQRLDYKGNRPKK